MDMIEKNIFRPLPNLKNLEVADQADGIEQEEEVDGSWYFLERVYSLFLQLTVAEFDPLLLKSYITPIFVQQFLGLFDSQIPSEREFLKNILHKLYAKIVPRRKMIRRIMD